MDLSYRDSKPTPKKTNRYREIASIVNYKNGLVFDLAIILICCLSFSLSWIESRVNLDSYHWGTMYIQALDIKRGLIPHKEAILTYGYLTSWIQGLSLSIFGESIFSIGIITGLFYSLSLFLSYRIFLLFLPKYLAFFSTFFIFLLHGYIVYAWSNYFSYTFFLIAVLLYFKDRQVNFNIIFAGLCLGLSFLCRYSASIAILPPFFIYLVYEFFSQSNSVKLTLRKVIFFSLGLIIPLGLFLGFLIYHNALNDFFIQNRVITVQWGELEKSSVFLRLIKSLILGRKLDGKADLRSYFFTFNLLLSLGTLLYFLKQFLWKKKTLKLNENIVIFVALITIFGYFNSLHVYNVFRLINGSSLGVGIIAYTFLKFSRSIQQKFRVILLLPIIAICFILANSLVFTGTSSVPLPWRSDVLLENQGVEPNEISMFKEKLLSKDYYNFYKEIFQKISQTDPSYHVINFTGDPIPTLLNDRPRIYYMSPFYIPAMLKEYPTKLTQIQELIDSKKAILIFSDKMAKLPPFLGKDIFNIPGYQMVMNKSWPADVPWIGSKLKAKFYLSVPVKTQQLN